MSSASIFYAKKGNFTFNDPLEIKRKKNIYNGDRNNDTIINLYESTWVRNNVTINGIDPLIVPPPPKKKIDDPTHQNYPQTWKNMLKKIINPIKSKYIPNYGNSSPP